MLQTRRQKSPISSLPPVPCHLSPDSIQPSHHQRNPILSTHSHSLSKALQQFLRNHFPISTADQQYLGNLTHSCQLCQCINPNSNLKPISFPTHQMRGSLYSYAPGSVIQIPPGPCGQFFGMGRTFPTTYKRAHSVAQILLTEIILRFGLPSSLQCDKGLEFISKVTQQLVQFLQILWKFHIPYHPQSSKKVERMNRIIKETITKLTLEVYLDWTKLLPIVLRIWALPRKPLGLSPFEVMYGRPMLPPGLPP